MANSKQYTEIQEKTARYAKALGHPAGLNSNSFLSSQQ